MNLCKRRYLRPVRVFATGVVLGLIAGLVLLFMARSVLIALEEALYFRITKPLEIIQGPLSGIVGTKEAVTAIYLLANNVVVSLIAVFGGSLLIRYTMKPDLESYSKETRLTNFLHRLVGEGNQTYKEASVMAYLLPLAVVFVNGAVFGLFSISRGLSWREVYVYLAYVLPHGVIELPAVILAATAGYANAVRLDALLDKGDLPAFFKCARGILRSRRSWGLFSLVFFMLVFAAAIETYVTPVVGKTALQNSYFFLEVLNNSVAEDEPALLYLRASFGATIVFRDGSGGPLPVELTGSALYPFDVDGRRIQTSESVLASELRVPENLAVFVLKFRVINVHEPSLVHVVASCRKLKKEANLTVVPR